ncbi:hypothetical protein [Paludisphaera mucosa]|uniref:DUF1795 domain-containing protein n=1 Tax=Paludisphaera mucosa TaxID=3030827 RepID=A0ABT6FCM8_9BACT|nr:hypothetical protein [Paludisphaera mucosa]MDG3005300.1 hypothetical protein [Paludisphaera mucosa]
MKTTLILAAILIGQATPARPYRSSMGDFTVVTPLLPQEDRSTDAAGEETATWTCEKDGRLYLIRRAPLEQPADRLALLAIYDRVEQAMVKGVNGQVLDKKDLTQDGRPVREITVEGFIRLPHANSGVAVVRFYQANGFAYTVTMAMPGDRVADSTRPEVDAYLNSFHLTAPPDALAETPADKPGMAAPKDAGKADWKAYASKQARYSIQMPGDPTEQATEPEIEGRKAKVLASAVVVQGASFAVVEMTLPEAVPRNAASQFLEASANGMVDGVEGRLSKSRPVTQGTLAGRELDYEGKLSDGSPGVFRSRVFLVGDRYYNLTVSAPPGKAPSKDAKRFFDSFKPEASKDAPRAKRRR